MAISKELQETIERTFELSSTLLDQASILKQKVDSIEYDKAVAELNNKVIRIKARENWANAEVRYYRALRMDVCCSRCFYDIKGQIFVTKPLEPTLYKGDYKPLIPPSCRHPEDWVRIWSRVAEKLHKYRKNLILQYAYGRNPADIAGSASKGLNVKVVDLEHSLKYAQGMTFTDGSVAFTSVKIGDQVWMSKNLAIDDGGEGVFYNTKNKEYYYTWDAAVRIAKAIPGWHLPSVDEWNEACEACGVESIERIDYVEDARELDDRLKVLPAGYYGGSFRNVGSYAYFWTITESGSGAYYRAFDTGATVNQFTNDKYYGFSVRLVKDS